MTGKEKSISIPKVTANDLVHYTRAGFIVSHIEYGMTFCNVYENYKLERTFCIKKESNNRSVYDDKLYIFDGSISVYDLSGKQLSSVPFGPFINRLLCYHNEVYYMESNGSLVMFSPFTYEVEIIPDVDQMLDSFAIAPSGIISGKLRTFPTIDGIFTLL